MTLLQYVTFCFKQLPLGGQEDLSIQLQEDFDDIDSSYLGPFCCEILLCWKYLALDCN